MWATAETVCSKPYLLPGNIFRSLRAPAVSMTMDEFPDLTQGCSHPSPSAS